MGARYDIVDLAAIPGVPCPCGTAKRAFTDAAEKTASIHLVDISTEARPHYHKTHTEIYYILEGTGHLELDGERVPVAPGAAVLIKPGCRHRAIPSTGAQLKLLNIPIPAFDPADEWFD